MGDEHFLQQKTRDMDYLGSFYIQKSEARRAQAMWWEGQSPWRALVGEGLERG